MTYNPLAEKTEPYMQALAKYLSNVSQRDLDRFKEVQHAAYEALHLKERPKGQKSLKIFEIPLHGTPPEKMARKILSSEFDGHPFYIETFSERVRRPYEDSEPDAIRVEVYPRQ